MSDDSAAALELLDRRQPAPRRLIREAIGQRLLGVLADETERDYRSLLDAPR